MSTRRHRLLRVVLAGTVVTMTAVVLPPSSPASATSIVPFGVAFTANENGSIAIFGNNLMVCPPTAGDCAATRAGATTRNNNNYSMIHLDADGAAFPTFSSSSAETILPDGAEVSWAGLYWGARLGRGNGGVAATGDGRQMQLRAPGDTTYRTITADRFFGPSATPDRAYQAFANVTAIVQGAGPGTYVGANVPAATGEDRHAGWSLVVAYRAPGLPLRNLTVFDGLADVGQNDPQSITISGFTTPVTGTVNSRIGLVAYEGDRGSSGDRAIFNGTQLATTLSPGTNFFNGTADDNGSLVRTRSPADVNMLGFDIKNFDAPGILGNSATSARIDLASTSERYFPGVVTTAIDVFAPDFSPSTKTVTNLTGGDPAQVGDTLRYTITFVNGGQDPAINTSIVDPLPAGTTYVPGSFTSENELAGGYDTGSNSIVVPSSGTFMVGTAKSFAFDVILGPDAAGSQLDNRAAITYDGATVPELRDLQFSTAAASTTVVASADLSITKENTPDPVLAGSSLTSTITVANDGPNAATDVVVTDELPAGLGTVTATSPAGSCTVAGRLVTCRIATLAADETATVTVVSAVPPDAANAGLTDVARVSSATLDPDPDDNTASATAGVARDADLSITKEVTPATVRPGERLTYTITATNNGPSTARGVVIDDSVPDPRIEPEDARLDRPGLCSADANGARCTVPTLPPGQTATMTVDAVARPDATPGDVPNTVTVSAATPDGNPGNDEVVEDVEILQPLSNLTVAKTASATPPLVAGLGEVRYVVDVQNTGPSRADPVTVTDVLPPGFAVVTATSDRGSCTVVPAPAGDTVTCVVGRLLAPFRGQPGGQASITIVAEVGAAVAPDNYANSATASAPSSPPTTSPPAQVVVSGLADLSITKSFPQGSTDAEITPGQTETYRLRVINEGPSVAFDVVVADALPAGLTATVWRVESVTPPGPAPVCADGAVTCDLGDLPPGTTIELELDVAVDPDLVIDPDVGVVNTATVTSATDDPNAGSNTSTFTAGGSPQADLSIRKIPPAPDREILPVPAPVAGLNTSYILEVINFGPSDAPGIVITDVLPPGVSFVRAFEPTLPTFTYDFCTGDGADPETVTCPLPFDFPAFVGTNLGIEVAIDPTVPDGTVLSNTATITSTAADGNAGNNSSNALVAVRAEVNLRVDKLVVPMDASGNFVPNPPGEPVFYPEALDPLGVAPGLPVSFAVIVTNEGPSAAADVQLIDAFPPEALTVPIDERCQFLAGETICRYTTPDPDDEDLLPPGGEFGTQIITIPLGDTPPDVYVNRGNATTSTRETTLADNVDTRPIEIIEPIADLVIDKTAVTSPLVAGEAFTYQVAVSAGIIDLPPPPVALRFSSDAQDVVVTDTLPAGLVPASATSSQGACTVTGQTVRCELGTVESARDLLPTNPALVTITGTVAPGIVGDTADNTATATTSTPLLGGGTSVTDTATTPVTRSADLTVTKVASAGEAAAGGGIEFTLTVTNAGPSDATGVSVTDLLPAPFEFSADGSDDECSLVDDDVVCALGTVTTESPRAVTIVATVPSGSPPGSVSNTASATSAVPDPDGSGNTDSIDVQVVQAADLTVTKTAAAEGVLLGDTIAYTLTVINQGPSDETGVTLTESIPAGTTIDSLPPGCTGAGPVECVIGDLPAGESVVLDLVLEVPDTLTPGALDNVATVTSTSPVPDPDPSNNSATATVEAVALADVTLEKVLVTADPIAGLPVAYELRLTNNGPTVAPNASLSDPIPTGSTLVSITADQGRCQLDEADVGSVPTASCALGRLAVGATATATLVVTTDPAATTITNSGSGGSGGLDEVPADNEDAVTTPLRRVADLSVVKSGPATVSSVAPATYVIEYRNDGPSTVTDAVVTDTLSAGLVPRPTAGCTVAGLVVTCAVGTLAPGATGSIAIVADVGPALALGAPLTDVATIDSSADDPDATDDRSEVTSVVDAQNDVGVTVTADQEAVSPGGTASFTVVVTNNGPQLAGAVVLTNQLPPELEGPIVAGGETLLGLVELPPGCVPATAASTATCAVGDLAVGASASFVFAGPVAGATPVGTQLVDTATVAFDGVDAVAANNADRDTIAVVASAVAGPTTTRPPGTTPRPRGSLPVVGAAVLGLLAVGTVLVGTGSIARVAANRPWRGRRR